MDLSLTDGELEALLCDLESERAERKRSIKNDKEKICEAICAFSNDISNSKLPGVVFIGIEDNGQPSGIPIDDELLKTLGGIRADGNIQPLPLMSVSKRRLQGMDLAVIVVAPAKAPPVRYKGVTWIRVGPRRAKATREEEQRLIEKRRAFDLPFDHQPVEGCSLEEIDQTYFLTEYLPSAVSEEFLRENDRSLTQKLEAIRMAQNSWPTVSGLLVCGKEPRNWIPGAYIQFVRFPETEIGEQILNQHEISGKIADQIRRLEEIIENHNVVSSYIAATGPEQKHPDYPLLAVSQILRNAVMHRNYETSNSPIRVYWFSDRIEIHNPGGPYGQVTAENFGDNLTTDYRNPNLSAAMKNLGFVQRFGAGIRIARSEMLKNGNPPPEFVIQPTAVLVTLKKRNHENNRTV